MEGHPPSSNVAESIPAEPAGTEGDASSPVDDSPDVVEASQEALEEADRAASGLEHAVEARRAVEIDAELRCFDSVTSATTLEDFLPHIRILHPLRTAAPGDSSHHSQPTSVSTDTSLDYIDPQYLSASLLELSEDSLAWQAFRKLLVHLMGPHTIARAGMLHKIHAEAESQRLIIVLTVVVEFLNAVKRPQMADLAVDFDKAAIRGITPSFLLQQGSATVLAIETRRNPTSAIAGSSQHGLLRFPERLLALEDRHRRGEVMLGHLSMHQTQRVKNDRMQTTYSGDQVLLAKNVHCSVYAAGGRCLTSVFSDIDGGFLTFCQPMFPMQHRSRRNLPPAPKTPPPLHQRFPGSYVVFVSRSTTHTDPAWLLSVLHSLLPLDVTMEWMAVRLDSDPTLADLKTKMSRAQKTFISPDRRYRGIESPRTSLTGGGGLGGEGRGGGGGGGGASQPLHLSSSRSDVYHGPADRVRAGGFPAVTGRSTALPEHAMLRDPDKVDEERILVVANELAVHSEYAPHSLMHVLHRARTANLPPSPQASPPKNPSLDSLSSLSPSPISLRLRPGTLGTGVSGIVVGGHTPSGAKVALKYARTTSAEEDIEWEAKVYRDLAAAVPSVVPHFYGFFYGGWPEETSVLVMEEFGEALRSLDELSKAERCAIFDLFVRVHQAGYEVLDVAERNILFDRSTRTFKLIDFVQAGLHRCPGNDCWSLQEIREWLEV
ncbi:hypothetical protein JCM10213_005529 [Rhodosporidiobolus nylandii]